MIVALSGLLPFFFFCINSPAMSVMSEYLNLFDRVRSEFSQYSKQVYNGRGFAREKLVLSRLCFLFCSSSLFVHLVSFYVTFVLSLFVPHLFLFWCIEKHVLHDCDMGIFTYFYLVMRRQDKYFRIPTAFLKLCKSNHVNHNLLGSHHENTPI